MGRFKVVLASEPKSVIVSVDDDMNEERIISLAMDEWNKKESTPVVLSIENV